jgi:hypothetical protein
LAKPRLEERASAALPAEIVHDPAPRCVLDNGVQSNFAFVTPEKAAFLHKKWSIDPKKACFGDAQAKKCRPARKHAGRVAQTDAI